MTFAGIISWIIANASTILKVLQTIDTIAVSLITVHGNPASSAYLKATSAALSSISPPTPAELVTMSSHTFGRDLQAP